MIRKYLTLRASLAAVHIYERNHCAAESDGAFLFSGFVPAGTQYPEIFADYPCGTTQNYLLLRRTLCLALLADINA